MLERVGKRRAAIIAIVVGLLYIVSVLSSSDDHQWYPYSSSTDNDALYRAQIASVRPTDKLPHSKTLGVADSIYVVSLARRTDRQELMRSIARALDLQFTFIDATDFRSARVAKIMERVKWQRPRIDEYDARPEDWPTPDANSSDHLIYHAFPFAWSQDLIENYADPLQNPIGISGADYWTLDPPDAAWEAEHPLPPKDDNKIMTTVVLNHQYKRVPLTLPMISCWDSHARIWRQMIEKGESVAIVLEDDVDMEFDIEAQLRTMWPALPPDWDIVMLGHCWSEEYRSAPLPGSSKLRLMHHTLCTHAYAVSRRGAMQLIRHLRSPDIAYSRPIDHAMKDLAQMHRVKTLSVYPQVVIQTKDGKSDIVGNRNNDWKEQLVDSTLERIRLLSNGTEGYLKEIVT
ncbi:hypothetical protein SISSUDRAFT_1046494 [Sistotremastrum suecicum HHB10207 ss-3]|uniref:Glycosyl transferase family 25 domain-containing protein n=1 Tax=Sistotremastrum suecicum HHB10207 ss-3 TaxID=1314776 RepID=A0A166DPB7_9AGAM|nr:hypothetical protein SISSUDRAFT_1046494 [Sistotremastrum suecicum HHB10207 ss-3]